MSTEIIIDASSSHNSQRIEENTENSIENENSNNDNKSRTCGTVVIPKRIKPTNRFLISNPEELKMNQYWYSGDTIIAMVKEIESNAKRVAFLSTPSVFFSLKDKELQKRSRLFDFDKKWKKTKQFVHYNFKEPEKIAKKYHHKFDYIVIDPPFITVEVWEKYATTAKLLLQKYFDESTTQTKANIEENNHVNNENNENKINQENIKPKYLCSTIPENSECMMRLFGAKPQKFQPSIPNLIYQYNFFCNYDSTALCELNPEIVQHGMGAGKSSNSYQGHESNSNHDQNN